MSDNPAVANYNEHAQFGVEYSRAFQHTEDDGTTPIPNTGKTASMRVRAYDGAPDPALITMTVAIGGANGVFTATATDEDMRAVETAATAEWTGVFDLVIIDGSGNPESVLVSGDFTIHPTVSVTQP